MIVVLTVVAVTVLTGIALYAHFRSGHSCSLEIPDQSLTTTICLEPGGPGGLFGRDAAWGWWIVAAHVLVIGLAFAYPWKRSPGGGPSAVE